MTVYHPSFQYFADKYLFNYLAPLRRIMHYDAHCSPCTAKMMVNHSNLSHRTTDGKYHDKELETKTD